MLDKKVMDIEASEAYLDHQISGMRQQKKTHDWIYNELNFIVLIKNIFHKKELVQGPQKYAMIDYVKRNLNLDIFYVTYKSE